MGDVVVGASSSAAFIVLQPIQLLLREILLMFTKINLRS